jgi:hypothetical protein
MLKALTMVLAVITLAACTPGPSYSVVEERTDEYGSYQIHLVSVETVETSKDALAEITKTEAQDDATIVGFCKTAKVCKDRELIGEGLRALGIIAQNESGQEWLKNNYTSGDEIGEPFVIKL